MQRALSLTVIIIVAACCGCSTTMNTISTVGTAVGEATGTITPQQAESIRRSAEAAGKSFEEITPEQEYFIGRTVAATILNTYRVYPDEAANHYLNVIGQALAQVSDKPETFSGYHFLIMDTDEVNAFAAPGGFILISRGMLRCCKTEDALAAVLAHEIGHVQHQHGLQAIKKGRLTSALTIMAMEGAKSFGGEQLAELTSAFEESISDITATLMNNGYSRGFERQADQAAVTIMRRMGYDPRGLIDMLEQMETQLKPGGLDFAKTHPSPESRISDIRRMIGNEPSGAPAPARQARFDKFISGI
ncbi:MAG: M48 family metalloprotease [Kiritimatiellia bacterium]|nr:M48 family metalloprotease [Lentisphaerota bacterium]